MELAVREEAIAEMATVHNRQHWDRSSNTLTEQERGRRAENQLCFNCGLSNHIRQNCTKPFNPNHLGQYE
jgi:hypothetical protein